MRNEGQRIVALWEARVKRGYWTISSKEGEGSTLSRFRVFIRRNKEHFDMKCGISGFGKVDNELEEQKNDMTRLL